CEEVAGSHQLARHQPPGSHSPLHSFERGQQGRQHAGVRRNPSRRQVPRPDDITGLDRPTCRYHSNGVVGRPQKGEVRYEGENCRQSHSEVTHTPSTSPSMPGAVGLHRSSSGWWIYSDGHSASRIARAEFTLKRCLRARTRKTATGSRNSLAVSGRVSDVGSGKRPPTTRN